MQLLVESFNTIYQPFLVILIYSAKAHIFLETTVPGVSLKKILPPYLPKHSVSNTVLMSAVQHHCLTGAPQKKKKAAFLIHASGIRYFFCLIIVDFRFKLLKGIIYHHTLIPRCIRQRNSLC